MAEASYLPAAAVSVDHQNLKFGGTNIYAPRRGFQLRLVLIIFCVGLFGLFPAKGILDWLSGGPVPNPKIFLAFIIFLVFPLWLLVVVVLNLLRGLPRLTISLQGVSFENSTGNKWANWDSLEPFAIKTAQAGRLRKPVQTLSARIVGPNAGGSWWSARTFSMPDCFDVPMDTVLQNLNEARSQAIGYTEKIPATAGDAPVGLAAFTLPWGTFILLGVLIAFFILENVFAVTPGVQSDPSVATLFAFGGISSKAILTYGQWYRLFMAPLLHASVAHIASNGIALLMAGWLLERLVGRAWFFAIFVVGALGGSLMSLAMVPSNLVSVGASGAIMGLFAALCVSSLRLAPGTPARTRMQISSARILVPSLIPLFSRSDVHIDYGAHFGGALSGAVVAACLLKFWPESERIPQHRNVAAIVSIIGACLFAASALIVAADYPENRAIENRSLPKTAPRQNYFSSSQQNSSSRSASPEADTESNILLDHGPGRVACDLKWSQSSDKSSSRYPDFLRSCMQK